MGQVRKNQRQAVTGYPNLKRETKDLKVYVDDLRSKDQGDGSVNIDGWKTVRTLLPSTRKSSPASKCVKQFDTSDRKETDENVEKGQPICAFPPVPSVKPKVGRKVIPQISNARSHLWRNRVSDAFIIMASKTQPKMDAQVFSRKSIKGPKTLEKSQVKHDISNVGRKVLDDVSSLRRSFSRTEMPDGSKPLKDQSKRITSLQRVSTDSCTRNASSSNSRIMGKVRENLRQAVAGYPNLKREAKDLKAYDLRSKGRGYGSVNIHSRKTARNPLPPTRKSLLASKWVKLLDTSDRKETDENLENGQAVCAFPPVKPKVGRKVIPQVSTTRSHLWRNRVSDGFIIMASKTRPKMDAQDFSRKCAKPIVKTTHRVSSVKMTLKSNCTSMVKKSTLVAAIPQRRKDEVVTFFSENSAVIPSDCNSNVGTNGSDSNATRKSAHRKSFTSLLVGRSKLLEGYGGAMKQESSPCIYDDCNHLEVAEYVDEIYNYYWIMEAQNQSLENYMAIQTEITPKMRGILINWLIEVHLKFDLMQETLYLTITLLDRYLSLVAIKKNEMQLVGLTALLLASKYEDFWHPRVLDLISISAESYTRDQMLGMEKAILKKLKFRLNAPTPYVFMLKFLRAAQSDTKLEHLAFYLIELCLVEYEALKFKPSLLCASAIYVARCTLQKIPAWTPLLGNHAGYAESQIRDGAEMVLKIHKAAKTAMLRVTLEKYSRDDYGGVASIKPCNSLPPLS